MRLKKYDFWKPISNALFGNTFKLVDETQEYDFWINDLKRVKKLSMENRLLHYRWLVDQIVKKDKMPHWSTGQ